MKDNMINTSVISEDQYRQDVQLCKNLISVPVILFSNGNSGNDNKLLSTGNISNVTATPNPAQNIVRLRLN